MVVGALALAARASSSGGTYALATTPLLSPLLSAVEGPSAPRFQQRQPKPPMTTIATAPNDHDRDDGSGAGGGH
jgi:hypothetical protein